MGIRDRARDARECIWRHEGRTRRGWRVVVTDMREGRNRRQLEGFVHDKQAHEIERP